MSTQLKPKTKEYVAKSNHSVAQDKHGNRDTQSYISSVIAQFGSIRQASDLCRMGKQKPRWHCPTHTIGITKFDSINQTIDSRLKETS